MQLDHARQLTTDALETLTTALESGKSEALTQYLSAMAHFHHYSFGNIMLILHQCPEATRVAGFTTWKTLGRFVKRGQKGIGIIAPMRIKKREEQRADGEEDSFLRFKVAHVFDISQTDGEDLPDLGRVAGDPGEHLDRLVAFATSCDISIEYTDALGAADGTSSMGTIQLRTSLDPAESFSVLAHEMAHELLHTREDRKELSKQVMELEAEATAFVVTSAIGLDVGTAAVDYIQLYRGDAQTLSDSLDRIQKAAQKILCGIAPPDAD